jgi:hypothetical protein
VDACVHHFGDEFVDHNVCSFCPVLNQIGRFWRPAALLFPWVSDCSEAAEGAREIRFAPGDGKHFSGEMWKKGRSAASSSGRRHPCAPSAELGNIPSTDRSDGFRDESGEAFPVLQND